MLASSYEAVFALLPPIAIAVVGYLVKRTIFSELDALKKEVQSMQLSKVDAVSCNNKHSDLKDDLRELKDMAKVNGDMMQKMAIDLAVVKTKINGD